MNFEQALNEYDYEYPEDAVALVPAEPRDAARLLVYDPNRGSVSFDTFRRLCCRLPQRSCVVFNETKVIPARIEVEKPTGGRARVLFLRRVGKSSFEALADRQLEPGSTVRVGDCGLLVESREQGRYVLTVESGGSPLELCESAGRMPLPPYLKRTPLPEERLRERYQTVFARETGSVAAPTASLHFTPRLMRDLEAAGHEVAFVTLHVNIGTFLPLKPEQLESGELHQESYSISPQTARAIARAKSEGRPVVAVGTTVVRALESAVREDGSLTLDGETRLFIRPGHRFRLVDGLITNFHVPKSSLMMLVSALVGRETLLDLYGRAVKAGFRLFSFGDGMLLLPRDRGGGE
ncbi:tRNA preQ1(34) S-adenosylmethionine ribosyltransferase-isomerase QueA [Patescibacteria group bacterium]